MKMVNTYSRGTSIQSYLIALGFSGSSAEAFTSRLLEDKRRGCFEELNNLVRHLKRDWRNSWGRYAAQIRATISFLLTGDSMQLTHGNLYEKLCSLFQRAGTSLAVMSHRLAGSLRALATAEEADRKERAADETTTASPRKGIVKRKSTTVSTVRSNV
jgi:hypothetical protein